MKTTLFAAIAALTIAAGAHAGTDPRKCSYTTKAAACAQDNAKLALRRYMSARYHFPNSLGWGSGSLTCTAATAKLTAWTCSFQDAPTATGGPATGTATVTFKALSNGWHARVALG